MTPFVRRGTGIVALIALTLTQGCVTAYPVAGGAMRTESRVEVRAPAGGSLQLLPAPGSDATAGCGAARVQGRLTAVRGDTLALRDVSIHEPWTAVRCATPREAYVVVSGGGRPDMRGLRVSQGRTFAFAVGVAVVVFLAERILDPPAIVVPNPN